MAAKSGKVGKSGSNVSFSEKVEVIGTSSAGNELNVSFSEDVESIGNAYVMYIHPVHLTT